MADLARHVERAGFWAEVEQRRMEGTLRWESGLSADFEWRRRLVSDWEPDPTKPPHPCATTTAEGKENA